MWPAFFQIPFEMKTLSNDQLKAKAADVFSRYNKAQKVAVTSDGTVFITDESENAVINHSKRNRYGKELKIYRFTRDDVESKDSEDEKTASDLIAEIEAATEVAVVEAILSEEDAGKKRKTVLKACEKKLKELKPAE